MQLPMHLNQWRAIQVMGHGAIRNARLLLHKTLSGSPDAATAAGLTIILTHSTPGPPFQITVKRGYPPTTERGKPICDRITAILM